METDELKIERTGRNAVTVRLERKAGNCGEFLLISDLHWDSVHCDRRLLKRTLDEAVNRNAGILVGGDLFDAMVGVGDRRGTKAELREELAGANYLDRLVDGAVEWFYPYRNNFVMIGKGNHDTSIIKFHETDLVARFCKEMGVQRVGYSAFVEFAFVKANGGGKKSFDLYYHHGYGGGGQATKGAGQHANRSMSVDADIFFSGHTHHALQLENQKVYLARVGDKREERVRTETHVVSPGFKDSSDMEGGWETEKGMAVKPKGGYWLQFFDRANEMTYTLVRTR